MKFEDIKSEKFSQFENRAITNLKLVVGVTWTNTENFGPENKIDRFNTGQPGHEDGWEDSYYSEDHIPYGIG